VRWKEKNGANCFVLQPCHGLRVFAILPVFEPDASAGCLPAFAAPDCVGLSLGTLDRHHQRFNLTHRGPRLPNRENVRDMLVIKRGRNFDPSAITSNNRWGSGRMNAGNWARNDGGTRHDDLGFKIKKMRVVTGH